MADILPSRKSCTVNPLKMSQPMGAALAFMGVARCMPLLHGSQGCTSFGLVMLVRHFREAIPLQTTAMSEVATVMGGYENLERAIVNIAQRTKPRLIGICSTGVTEIKGDDIAGFLTLIRQQHPELRDIALVQVATPDFKDAFQDGWGRAVTAMIDQLVPPRPVGAARHPARVNLLPGCHLTPGDIEEVRDIVEAFGLEARVLPDLSGSLDGHIPGDFTPTTLGGTPVDAFATLGDAAWTIAIGEQMRPAAQALEDRAGVPFRLFDRLTGLAATDALIRFLADISGRPVPARYRRQRGQLVDAMLDGHFFFGGKRIAIGAEPDLLWAAAAWLSEMGAEIACAVTTTASPLLAEVPTARVIIGDLEDLEAGAAAENADLLITHAHGRQAAARLGIPLFRLGLPQFDRLGAAHQLSVGYRGTRDLIFAIGNLFLADDHEPTPDSWRGDPAPTPPLAAPSLATPHHFS